MRETLTVGSKKLEPFYTLSPHLEPSQLTQNVTRTLTTFCGCSQGVLVMLCVSKDIVFPLVFEFSLRKLRQNIFFLNFADINCVV